MNSGLPLTISLLAMLLVLPNAAQARAFDFKSESFATYVRGTFGTSAISDSAYAGNNPSGVTDDEKVSTSYSGEFGIIFAGQKVNFRVGLEYLLPHNLSTISGSNAAATKLYTLDSKVTALIPMASLEYLFHTSSTSHFLVGAGGGVAFVTLDNKYAMTAAGNTAFSPISDYEEQAKGQGTMGEIYTGYEVNFTDSVTAVFDLGYRYLKVPSLAASQAATAFNGNETTGANLTNANGSTRTLDLGGVFAGFSFRFYLHN